MTNIQTTPDNSILGHIVSHFRQLHENATAAPWSVGTHEPDAGCLGSADECHFIQADHTAVTRECAGIKRADAELIAEMRNDLPDLLHILETQARRLREFESRQIADKRSDPEAPT